MNDLSALKSLLYINSDSIMATQNKADSLKNLIEAAAKYYSDLLPRILYGIQEMQEVSYFDFKRESISKWNGVISLGIYW